MPSTLPILMIDDNAFFARHVRNLCVEAEPGVQERWMAAATAAEGLALTASARPGVILLDPTLHADESRLEEYCRELASAVSPAATTLLFVHNPLQQFDGVLARLADCPNLSVDSLAKPFERPALQAKLEDLQQRSIALSAHLMSNTFPTPQKFSWILTTPEITGYAHIGADGGVLEWNGSAQDEGSHGALMYMLRLASLCGEEFGLGAASELQTLGREGSSMSVAMADGAVVNVLGSPRANHRAISTRVLTQPV